MILIIIIVLVSLIIYIKWCQSYWKRRGIVQVKPPFIFGLSRNKYGSSFAEAVVENYTTIKSSGQKHGGLYFFKDPIYMPTDLTIIKNILQRDFIHFTDHGFYNHPKDILSMNLFNMEGENWKKLRAKLTPTFTSGKIKMMFETLLEKTTVLEKQVGKHAGTKNCFAIKDVLGRFTTDVIASCAFGIECNSMEEPDNEFRKHGLDVFGQQLRHSMRFWVSLFLPASILANLGFKLNGRGVTSFFIETVDNIIKHRESDEIYRKDFMHLLLQIKNQGMTSDSTKISDGNSKNGLQLTDEEIIAQCFVFFAAGFETSSSTMTFAMFEIAQNLEIQDKLRQEINNVIKKYNGEITYDAVMEMTYLDKVVNETLRKYPPVVILPRVCTKKYKVPETDLTIEKGTTAQIPVFAIHRDPEYYPNPEVYDPERFNEENKANRPDMSFIPFGEGPRMCIGLRFGVLQAKVGLISLLRSFQIKLNKRTELPLKIDTDTFILSVAGDIWIDVEKVNNNKSDNE